MNEWMNTRHERVRRTDGQTPADSKVVVVVVVVVAAAVDL